MSDRFSPCKKLSKMAQNALMCGLKVRYKTRQDATQKGYRVYPCPVCKGFHRTTKRVKKKDRVKYHPEDSLTPEQKKIVKEMRKKGILGREYLTQTVLDQIFPKKRG